MAAGRSRSGHERMTLSEGMGVYIDTVIIRYKCFLSMDLFAVCDKVQVEVDIVPVLFVRRSVAG